MAKCNTQAHDMARTANNWQTPGASDPGRYNKRDNVNLGGILIASPIDDVKYITTKC